LWNPKSDCLVHWSLPPVFVLRQANPVHIVQFYYFKIHSNIILACIPKPSGSRPEHYMHLWSVPCALNTYNPSFLDFVIIIVFDEKPLVISFLLAPTSCAQIFSCAHKFTLSYILPNLCYFACRFSAFPSIFSFVCSTVTK
jgi:hypothetical protein